VYRWRLALALAPVLRLRMPRAIIARERRKKKKRHGDNENGGEIA